MAIAASFLVLVVAANYFIFNPTTPTMMAQNYLQSASIEHPGVLKGVRISDESNRLMAIQAYDKKEYTLAIQYFESLQEQSVEDQFITAVSQLNTGQYDQAIEGLNEIQITADAYDQEAQWLLGLSYVLSDQPQKAIETPSAIKSGDWQYDHAQELLKRIKE